MGMACPSPSGTPTSTYLPQDRLSAAPVASDSHPGTANKTFILAFSYIIQGEKHYSRWLFSEMAKARQHRADSFFAPGVM